MAEILDRGTPWAITLVAHNWPVLLYTIIALIAGIRAYIAPSRPAILFMYGALVLIVAFEYEKHGRDTIIGTTEYLFSLEVNPHLRTGSRWLLLDVVPVVLRVLGFGMLIGSVALRERESRRRARPRRAIFVDL